MSVIVHFGKSIGLDFHVQVIFSSKSFRTAAGVFISIWCCFQACNKHTINTHIYSDMAVYFSYLEEKTPP